MVRIETVDVDEVVRFKCGCMARVLLTLTQEADWAAMPKVVTIAFTQNCPSPAWGTGTHEIRRCLFMERERDSPLMEISGWAECDYDPLLSWLLTSDCDDLRRDGQATKKDKRRRRRRQEAPQ